MPMRTTYYSHAGKQIRKHILTIQVTVVSVRRQRIIASYPKSKPKFHTTFRLNLRTIQSHKAALSRSRNSDHDGDINEKKQTEPFLNYASTLNIDCRCRPVPYD